MSTGKILIKPTITLVQFQSAKPLHRYPLNKQSILMENGKPWLYLRVSKDSGFHVNVFRRGQVVTVIHGLRSQETNCCLTEPRRRFWLSWPRDQIRLHKSQKCLTFPLPTVHGHISERLRSELLREAVVMGKNASGGTLLRTKLSCFQGWGVRGVYGPLWGDE